MIDLRQTLDFSLEENLGIQSPVEPRRHSARVRKHDPLSLSCSVSDSPAFYNKAYYNLRIIIILIVFYWVTVVFYVIQGQRPLVSLYFVHIYMHS